MLFLTLAVRPENNEPHRESVSISSTDFDNFQAVSGSYKPGPGQGPFCLVESGC